MSEDRKDTENERERPTEEEREKERERLEAKFGWGSGDVTIQWPEGKGPNRKKPPEPPTLFGPESPEE